MTSGYVEFPLDRPKGVYLSLGSNLGDRELNLSRAIGAIEKPGTRVVRRSPLYETEPQGLPSQPWFLNLVIEIATRDHPEELLDNLQQIELEMGRVRTVANFLGPRIIDIDILLFGDVNLASERLTIPHPRMWERRFMLMPLHDIAGESLRRDIERYLEGLEAQTVLLVEAKH